MLGAANGPVAVLSTALHVDSGTSSDDDDGLHDWARDMVKGVCCMVAVLGGVGNLLTLTAVPYASRCCRAPREVKRLRYSTATVFILNLAVADLLYCLVNLPLYYLQYSRPSLWRDPAHGFACPLAGVLRYTNAAADWMSLAGIAFNRYVSQATVVFCRQGIMPRYGFDSGEPPAGLSGDEAELMTTPAVCPFRYVLIGHNHLYSKIYRFPCIVAMAIAVWIFSFAMMLPPLLEVWGRLGLDERTFSCTILKKNGKSPKKMLFAVGVLLPCLIIVTCYALIFVKVRRSRQTIRGHSMHGARTSMSPSKQSEQQKNNARKEDMRLTKMMLTIFLAFLACFFPLMLVNVFDDDDVRYPSLHVVAWSVLAWMSQAKRDCQWSKSMVVVTPRGR
ncbi:protein trapped in endoderm-1-like [Pollicipes pollicipes]|uniref:protein trapped in endoderm-1-like n=1 Tax=Pollicipes pollicipes TaxID=41117 RepID=UPI0018859287|nr:protein trapped in endoderm-1-like [Pollicipes pollicipes]